MNLLELFLSTHPPVHFQENKGLYIEKLAALVVLLSTSLHTKWRVDCNLRQFTKCIRISWKRYLP